MIVRFDSIVGFRHAHYGYTWDYTVIWLNHIKQLIHWPPPPPPPNQNPGYATETILPLFIWRSYWNQYLLAADGQRWSAWRQWTCECWRGPGHSASPPRPYRLFTPVKPSKARASLSAIQRAYPMLDSVPHLFRLDRFPMFQFDPQGCRKSTENPDFYSEEKKIW